MRGDHRQFEHVILLVAFFITDGTGEDYRFILIVQHDAVQGKIGDGQIMLADLSGSLDQSGHDAPHQIFV